MRKTPNAVNRREEGMQVGRKEGEVGKEVGREEER